MHSVSLNWEQLVSEIFFYSVYKFTAFDYFIVQCPFICCNLVPKSGAEYAYLYETFGKLHKFWGPLPAFICNWVYVMVLRPAEVAIIILICASYAIQPISHLIGLDVIEEDKRKLVFKLLAISLLGKIIWYFMFLYNYG